jgi:hypothetical protein
MIVLRQKTLCDQNPCDWTSFGDEIVEECNEMANDKLLNKEVCAIIVYFKDMIIFFVQFSHFAI